MVCWKSMPVWCHDYTQRLMDIHNLSSLWALTGWSLNKKCHWHYKESYGPLGGRSERSIPQLHTAGSVQTLKWQQRAGLSPPHWEREKKNKQLQHGNIKENKTDVCPILQLNGVRLLIVHSPFHPISRFLSKCLIVNQNRALLSLWGGARSLMTDHNSCFFLTIKLLFKTLAPRRLHSRNVIVLFAAFAAL